MDGGYAVFFDLEQVKAIISAGVWETAKTEGTELDAWNTASGFLQDSHHGVRGTICIVNGGEEATENLQVDMQVQYQRDGESGFKNVVGAVQRIKPQEQLPACDTPNNPESCPKACYDFEIDFEPVDGGAVYRNFEQVTITNHKDWQPGSENCPGPKHCPFGPIIKTLFDLPVPPTSLQTEQTAEVFVQDNIGVRGDVCVTNTGAFPTKDLTITNTLLAQTEGEQFEQVASLLLDINEKPILNAGETHCYPYRYAIPNFSYQIETLQNIVQATITNYEGWLPGGDHCQGPNACPYGEQIKTELTIPNISTKLLVDQTSEVFLQENNASKPFGIRGEVCVQNAGSFPTRDLAIREIIQIKNNTGNYVELTSDMIDTSQKSILGAGEHHCYPYETVFQNPTDAAEGRHLAEVTITNYAGWLPGGGNCPGPKPCPGGPSVIKSFTFPLIATYTPTFTETLSPTSTPTPTNTYTHTLTNTPTTTTTVTLMPTLSPTHSPTPTSTPTTNTKTPTSTATPSATFSPTPTPSSTQTPES